MKSIPTDCFGIERMIKMIGCPLAKIKCPKIIIVRNELKSL